MNVDVVPVTMARAFIEKHRSGTSIFLNFSPLSTGLYPAGPGYSFHSDEEYTQHLEKLAWVLRDRFVEVFTAAICDPDEPVELPKKLSEVLEVSICPKPQQLDNQLFNFGEVYFWLPNLQLKLDFVIKVQLALYLSVERDPVEVDGLYVLFYGSGFRQT